MPSLRTRQNGRIRCHGHDYRSRCIYHIVLNKAPGIPDFSTVIDIPYSHYWKPRTQLTPIGKAVATAISGLKAEFPFTSVLRRCIMPDHVHIAFYVRQASVTHLGIMIKAIKNSARINLNMQDSIFEEGYYDKILMILHPDPFKHEKPSREHCLYMNSVAERITEGRFTVQK